MKVLFGGYTDHASQGLYEAFLDQQNPNPSITNLKILFSYKDQLIFKRTDLYYLLFRKMITKLVLLVIA